MSCSRPPHQRQQSQAESSFDIHGQQPPPSPRPHPHNVNVHQHHHHHHNLPTPASPYWHVHLTSPYHHQYYPLPYRLSLPPPFSIQYYPNYYYEDYYGGGAAAGASIQEAPKEGPGLVLSNQQLGRHPYTMPNWQPKSEEELRDSIRYQVEFYFSVDNLTEDWYLRNKMDEQGWVCVDVIASFPMIKRKCRDIDLILESLKPSLVVEVEGKKMRRRDDWTRWIGN